MLLGKKYSFWAAIGFLAVACFFCLFWQLETLIMQEWDEARNSVHAINMDKDGNYLVRMYQGPDMWETKPPLFIWLQVICLKIFGYGTWVFRLPSALAALGTIWLIVHFLWKQTHSLIPGITAGFIMLTSGGYLFDHCARSANHDALLIFFETGLILSFYSYLTAAVTQNKYLLWCFIYFTLAVFTKSIAVLMVCPGLFIFSFYKGKIFKLIKTPLLYLYALVSFSLVFLYYYMHEMQTPGYLQAVWENELFPRYFNSAKTYTYNKVDGVFHYLNVLANQNFKLWIWFVIPAFIAALWVKNNVVRQLAIFFGVVATVFYLVTCNGTFNAWYITPIIPMLAIIIGVGMFSLFTMVSTLSKPLVKTVYLNVVLLIAAGAVLYEPMRKTLKAIEYPWEPPQGYYGKLFGDLRNDRPDIKAFKVYLNRHNQSAYFYTVLYNKVHGYTVTIIDNTIEVKPGDLVMAGESKMRDELEKSFSTTIVATFNDCVLYRIGLAKTRFFALK